MEPALLIKMTESILSTGNLALTILFGGVIYFARQLARERQAREDSDKLDREYAERHNETQRAMVGVLGRLEGLISNMGRK